MIVQTNKKIILRGRYGGSKKVKQHTHNITKQLHGGLFPNESGCDSKHNVHSTQRECRTQMGNL